jgi:DNA replication protein DnaC
MQLRQTMAAAAQAVFAQGGDVQSAMNRAREENQALQAQRKALLEANFAPGYLDEAPACPHCDDTGYIGSAMCQCLHALCRQEQRKELGTAFSGGESFQNFRLDYYPDTVIPELKTSARNVMEKNLRFCREYAEGFSCDAGNLLLCGGTGLGKTHLALAMGAAIVDQGYSVCYETAISLFSKLEKAKFTPSETAAAQAERLESCDLLIIDDLGTEMPGQFVTAALYGLLNQRLLSRKPMIITTNLTVSEAGVRYSPQIASRLYGEFIRRQFLGTDIRILKNRGI